MTLSSFSLAVPAKYQCHAGLLWESPPVVFLLRGAGKAEHEW